MDAATRETLKTELEFELARLEAEAAEMQAASRELLSEASGENAYRDHMADQGSATFERELDLSLEANVREHLEHVRAALERIDAGSYGVCERCAAEIPEDRLRAIPTTSLCVRCKTADESR